jgi:hypothetical protein
MVIPGLRDQQGLRDLPALVVEERQGHKALGGLRGQLVESKV